jgi:hypothetical protein
MESASTTQGNLGVITLSVVRDYMKIRELGAVKLKSRTSISSKPLPITFNLCVGRLEIGLFFAIEARFRI